MEGAPITASGQKRLRLLKERPWGWDEPQIMTNLPGPKLARRMATALTVEEVRAAGEAGNKKIAVCAPAFSADCIETRLEEINEEIKGSLNMRAARRFQLYPSQ